MFDKKQNEILMSVGDNPNKSIWVHSELTKTTYAHTHKIIKDFVRRNILELSRSKDNRSKLVNFTKMGKLLLYPIQEYSKSTMRYK